MKLCSKILKQAFLISLFSTVSVSGTVFIHKITQSKIIYQQEQEQKNLLKQVIPDQIFNKFKKKNIKLKTTF